MNANQVPLMGIVALSYPVHQNGIHLKTLQVQIDFGKSIDFGNGRQISETVNQMSGKIRNIQMDVIMGNVQTVGPVLRGSQTKAGKQKNDDDCFFHKYKKE